MTIPYPTPNFGLTPDFTAQYSSNLELLLQQEQSILRPYVTEQGGIVGKMAAPVTQYSSVTMRQAKGRGAPLDFTQPYSIRPWIFPQTGELAERIDEFDQLQTIVNPKTGYVRAAAAATGRYWDDNIIANATGQRQIGVDIGNLLPDNFSTSLFQVSSTFGSSSASGLTVAKIIEARRILEHYHNNLERDPPVIIMGSQQKSDLYNQVQFTSTEFRSTAVYDQGGRLKEFMGCSFAVSERLSVSSSVRTVLMFPKSGVILGMWKDMETNIDQRIDLSGRPWQVTTRTMFGSVRSQNGKVVSIACSDSSGQDITP